MITTADRLLFDKQATLNVVVKPGSVPHYLRHPTTVLRSLSTGIYNQAVRNYTTQRIKGGLQFTCVRCPHSVRTLDLDLRDGNLRTQAATALNQHATQVHNQPTTISAPDVQQRIWRS